MKPLASILHQLNINPRQADVQTAPVVSTSPCLPGCSICGGQGWMRCDVPVGHPNFGKLVLCPNASLLRLPIANQYGLAPDESRSLNWDQVLERGNVLKAVSVIQQILLRGYGWVYLWGSFGQGKTLILKIAVAETLRQRQFASYVRMTEMVDNLRAAFDAQNPSAEAERRLEWWTDLPVLAVDEIDRLRQTAYAAEQQFLLLDRRYEQALRQRSITLLAANTAPEQLPGYLADRILDGRFTIVRLTGDSARLGMDWEILA